MSSLKEVLAQKIEAHRPRTARLLKEAADVKTGEVTIAQAIGGARGVRCLVTDISYLDPNEGIGFRGKTIPETFAARPKAPGSEYPYVDGHTDGRRGGGGQSVHGRQRRRAEREPAPARGRRGRQRQRL